MSDPDGTIPVYGSVEEVWRDADLISGAVNPMGVGGALVAAMRRLSMDGLDIKAICRHPAVLVMFDVLAQIMRHENWTNDLDTQAIDAYREVALHVRAVATAQNMEAGG